MKILITGGTGFIGGPVLNNLIENIDGIEILNLTKSRPNSYSKEVEHYNCDLSNPQTYQAKVEAFEPEVVIHLAWEGIPDFSLEMCIKNINSSILLIEIVTKVKSCKKIIITGSCFEYNNKIGECNENDNVVSKDYFTFAKKTVLSFLELECSKNNIVFCWARLFYVYGPNQRSGSLIPTLIATLKSNKIPDLRTPKNENDFIHVNDVADGLMKLALTDIQSGIFNLGSGISISVAEVSRIVELTIKDTDQLTNELINKTINTEKTVDFHANMEKTNKTLSWHPQRIMSEEMRTLITEF
jgi:nucleoside-diphosphate-sugar epimerase